MLDRIRILARDHNNAGISQCSACAIKRTALPGHVVIDNGLVHFGVEQPSLNRPIDANIQLSRHRIGPRKINLLSHPHPHVDLTG